MTSPTINGMFRGICVDTNDPKNLGRIRVQVPQILGTAASGWAFPAWSFHSLTVWPQDRLPKPGDGVWVMFDSTSPDKMIWTSAFGPLDLIDQPGYTPDPDFTSTVTIAVASPPVWNEVSTFYGVLSSDGGIPNPNPVLSLWGRVGSGEWEPLVSDISPDPAGNWTVDYKIDTVGTLQFRVIFDGVGVYSSASATVSTVVAPVILETTLTISMTDPTPMLEETVPFSGTLLTTAPPQPEYAIPHPATVSLKTRPAGGSWTTVKSGIEVDPLTGNWSTTYKILTAGSVEYQAVFAGVGIYDPSISAVLPLDVEVGVLGTSLTVAMTDPSPSLNKTVPFSGKLITAGSPPSGYEVPGPGAVVSLKAKPSGGSWSTIKSGIAVNASTGDWSTTYAIATAGSVDYQAVFDGFGGIFTSTSSNIINVTTAKPTTVSTPSLPTLYHGTGFNVSGTIKDNVGASVTSGTVELWYRKTTGSNLNWYRVVGPVSVTNGTYSLTHPAMSFVGACQFYVKYIGSSTYVSSQSSTVSSTVYLRGNGALTKGSVSHSSAAFSWAAVSGATYYEVIRSTNGGGYGSIDSSNTSRSVNNTGLSTSTSYSYQVRPKAQDAAGTWFYGSYSAAITMNTGRPEQTDSGTERARLTVEKIDSHRNDSYGWDYPVSGPDFFQGYYSTPYGGYGYIGVAKYTGTRVKDAIIAACGGGTLGTTRWSKGTCTLAEISLKRGNAGGASPVSLGFQTSMSKATGDRPVRDGSTKSTDSQSANASSYDWHNIGTAHGQRIGEANANSITIYRNNSGDYAQFYVGDLRLDWTWNYVSVSYIAPSWS